MTTRMLEFNCPGTGEQFGQIPMATPDDVTRAREEMRQAFEVWRGVTLSERIKILKKLQRTIVQYADEIAVAISQDTGKSRQDGLIEVIMTTDKLHIYLKYARQWLARWRVPPGLYFFRQFYATRQPYGVVAVIGPWNYPFDLGMPPIFSALLAGNTVMYKPSEVAGATGRLIEKIIQSVPELSPYVRVLHGDGSVGAALVQAEPDLVFLTGSVATGRKVAVAAAEKMIPFLSELGGKDPMIVLEDADLDAAARWGVWGAFYNVGQTCMSIERVYVIESVYDAFLEKAIAETRKVEQGFSSDIDCPFHIGPLTFNRQLQVVEDHLADALAKGARIACGGEKNGLFVQPMILVDVTHDMKVMCEETFGPIMPIMKVADEAEAIRLANDSEFGLSACVWGRDQKHAQQVARQLEVGSVNINDAISHYPVSLLPFGGIKQSGTARTHGKDEVLQFTQIRSYAVGVPPLPFDVATLMRQPGHYNLGKAILEFFFGVGPQRLAPIARLAASVDARPAARKVATGGAIAAAATAIVFGLFRNRSR